MKFILISKRPMYIKGIPKNSQDILADLVHPQQDGTFRAGEQNRTVIL